MPVLGHRLLIEGACGFAVRTFDLIEVTISVVGNESCFLEGELKFTIAVFAGESSLLLTR
jgi:hypothetical protein